MESIKKRIAKDKANELYYKMYHSSELQRMNLTVSDGNAHILISGNKDGAARINLHGTGDHWVAGAKINDKRFFSLLWRLVALATPENLDKIMIVVEDE